MADVNPTCWARGADLLDLPSKPGDVGFGDRIGWGYGGVGEGTRGTACLLVCCCSNG